MLNAQPPQQISQPDTAAPYPSQATEGLCSFENFALGLNVHLNDCVEQHNAQVHCSLPPRLTVVLILEGTLEANIDEYPLKLNAGNGPQACLWLNRRSAQLERWLHEGQRMRKVVISVPFEQLSFLFGSQDTGQLRCLSQAQKEFSFLQWKPSAHAIRYAEELLASKKTPSPLDKLDTSIAALTLLRHALMHALQTCASDECSPGRCALSTRDAKRARQVRQYLLQHIHRTLSMKTLASQAGMSVSTMQRVFKNTYHMTVMEFVRTRRLELARLALLEDGATVSEVAYQAGYSCVSNFSTAFLREFGYQPSACTREAARKNHNGD